MVGVTSSASHPRLKVMLRALNSSRHEPDVAMGGTCPASSSRRWWGEQDSNLRRRCHQIYSLTPLAAREPPQGDKDPSVIHGARERMNDQADLDSDAGCRYQCRTPRGLAPTGALLPCHPVRVPL